MKAPKTFPASVSQQGVTLVPIGRPIIVREHVKREPDRDRPFPEASEYWPPREIPLQKRCFIHRLPKSLLLLIFRYYLYDYRREEHRTRDLAHNPEFRKDDAEKHLHTIHSKHKPALTSNFTSSASQFTLFAVCKYWRSFYHYQPLWASLAVYKPRMAQLPTIAFWLKQSAIDRPHTPIPIALYLYAPVEDEGYDSQAVETILTIFLDSHNTRRLYHLTLKLAGERLSYIFPRTFDAPNLRSLELDFGNCHLPLSLMHFVYRRNTMLKKFFWRPVLTERPWLGVTPWDMLTHIKFPLVNLGGDQNKTFRDLLTTLIYCENLFSLEIVMVAPSLSHSEHPLPQVDCLQQERTQYFLKERGPFEMFSKVSQDVTTVALKHQVILPQLNRLKFEAYGYEADPFLFRIKAPKLRSLEIIHHKDLHKLSGLFAFLHSSYPPLTCLTIYDPEMDNHIVIRLLGFSLPMLRHLELCVAPVGNRVMRALTITRRDQNPMPNIRTLILPECTASNGHLVDMVMSRRPMLMELRLSLPTTIKTGPRRRIVAKNQYKELCYLREVTRNLREAQFSLIVD